MRWLKPSISKTLKLAGVNPSVATMMPRLLLRARALVGDALAMGLLPVASVEVTVPQRCDIHVLQAADVHVDLVGRRARNVVRSASANRAEVMLRDAGVEGVGDNSVIRAEQPEALTRHDPVQVTLLRTDRTVALDRFLELALDLERNLSAMTSASISSHSLSRAAHDGLTKRAPRRATSLTRLDAGGKAKPVAATGR